MAIVILGVGCYTLDFSWHDFIKNNEGGIIGSGPFPGVIG